MKLLWRVVLRQEFPVCAICRTVICSCSCSCDVLSPHLSPLLMTIRASKALGRSLCECIDQESLAPRGALTCWQRCMDDARFVQWYRTHLAHTEAQISAGSGLHGVGHVEWPSSPPFLSSVAGMAGRQAVTWDLCALRAADANAQLSMGRGEHLEENFYQMTIVEAMCLRQLLLRKRLTVAHFTRHWQHLMLQCCGSRIAAVHQYVTIHTGMYVIFNSYKKYTITTRLSSDRLS